VPLLPLLDPVGLFRRTPRGVWAALWPAWSEPGCGPAGCRASGPASLFPLAPSARFLLAHPGNFTETSVKLTFSVIVRHQTPYHGDSVAQ
jgi:hypothetical protein